MDRFIRTRMLLGDTAAERFKNAHIAVFGVGGVGSYAAEAVARCGVGKLTLIDNDVVSVSNINRQLIALDSTVGMPKAEVMKQRIADINPQAKVYAVQKFYLPANRDEFDFSDFDYIIDAVDTISAKIDIIERAYKMNIPCISSMGAGNKLHPEMFELADIYDTSVCPLARVMRRELKKRGVERLCVVYSKEKALAPLFEPQEDSKKAAPASISFVPSAAGLIIAGKVIRDLAGSE